MDNQRIPRESFHRENTMAEPVTFTQHDAIGVITVDNPPVNALSPGIPEGIKRCLQQGNADPEVKAMVLIGAGRTFIAGADIKHLGKPRPTGKRNQELIEENDKPVVAAIHGYALGGGLELALGCHYRIAVAGAKVGLPEVLIGIIPGGGGTQRLPRLIGPRAALDLIVSGRHVPAPEAKALGILDQVVEGDDLLAGALAFAAGIAEQRPLPRISAMSERLDEAGKEPDLFETTRVKIARRARNQNAPQRCIDAVQAAVELPFQTGLAREREIFEALVNADEAKALRYAFFSERKARDIPGVTRDVMTRTVHSVAVVGGGTMGSGIARALSDAGIPVHLLEVSREALEKAIDRIRTTYAVSVKRGSIDEEEVSRRMALITPTTEYDALARSDMVIEAVFEDMQVKQQVFAKLDTVMKAEAILATNTSALDIDAIAAAIGRPESVIGTHFFSPANVMKLLEIVRGARTSPEIIASVLALAKAIGKVGVVSGNCDGFTANRSRIPFNTEMNILIEEGATPEQVDKAMVDFGYPMGPFAVADLAGGDIGYAGRKRREAEYPHARKLPIADRLVEIGRYGQKTGAGWYRYKPGDRTPLPDPEVERIIGELRRELGVELRSHTDEEILHRILFASVNEACRILEEGIAYRPGDIDTMWLNGFGFPRYRGGLMYWADGIGIEKVHARMRDWVTTLGSRWHPAKLLTELVDSGRSFADL
jgi:3-hydroxyacyl-CoA dehydrogenase